MSVDHKFSTSSVAIFNVKVPFLRAFTSAWKKAKMDGDMEKNLFSNFIQKSWASYAYNFQKYYTQIK